jgi:chromosome segregation ATPase
MPATDNHSGAANEENSNSSETQSSGVKRVNGNVDPEVMELRRQIEKSSCEQGKTHSNLSDLRQKNAELDERIIGLNKELHSSQGLIKRLEIELNEHVAQKDDQEERIATLEKRYLNAQRESTMLHDLNEKLEQELKNKEDQFLLRDDKIKAISAKLDMSEQRLIEFASMPDIEEQLKDRMEALTQAQERQGTAEERVQGLESQLEEKNADALKLFQRLKMNEEHNQRLSATVDKLLSGTHSISEQT